MKICKTVVYCQGHNNQKRKFRNFSRDVTSDEEMKSFKRHLRAERCVKKTGNELSNYLY